MNDYKERVSRVLRKVPTYDHRAGLDQDDVEDSKHADDESLKGDLDKGDVRRMLFLFVMILLSIMFSVWLTIQIISWAVPSQ